MTCEKYTTARIRGRVEYRQLRQPIMYSGTSLIWTPLGQTKVSLIQGLLSTQMWHLGQIKVSCLEWCPYRGVPLYV